MPTKRLVCRGCNSKDLKLIHDFGQQPLAGEFPLFPNSKSSSNSFPLDLTQCCSCGLLQVCNVPPVDMIFHDDYRYSTSTIPSLLRHFDAYAQWIAEKIPKGANILEFGCNDGALLSNLIEKGFNCKGVDASANIAKIAQDKGLDVDIDFFGLDYVEKKFLEKKFDLITCSNVYAHIDDLSGVTKAVFNSLKEGGFFAIEVHDGDLILKESQFDTIYHEHLTYFTKESIITHLNFHGFKVEELSHIDMHGGGLRVLARRTTDSIDCKFRSYRDDASRNTKCVNNQLDTAYLNLDSIKHSHGKIWGYGAAGRSQMFLAFTNTSAFFECIYDDSPLRQGRYIVSSDLQIREFQFIKHEGACLILAWNYAHDIVERISPFFDAVYTVIPSLKKW
ncbi:class I SAM-dependent methyltransferase [bacterium]|nr:class I SAM-dependent methyltransferase [bacterium]MDB4379557.1 class I SAM-dependent methyltransferase [bacterium]